MTSLQSIFNTAITTSPPLVWLHWATGVRLMLSWQHATISAFIEQNPNFMWCIFLQKGCAVVRIQSPFWCTPNKWMAVGGEGGFWARLAYTVCNCFTYFSTWALSVSPTSELWLVEFLGSLAGTQQSLAYWRLSFYLFFFPSFCILLPFRFFSLFLFFFGVVYSRPLLKSRDCVHMEVVVG